MIFLINCVSRSFRRQKYTKEFIHTFINDFNLKKRRFLHEMLLTLTLCNIIEKIYLHNVYFEMKIHQSHDRK